MLKYKDKVFTYAGSREGGAADLLFHTLPHYDVARVTPEVIEEIMKDPQVAEVLGSEFAVIPTNDYILISSGVSEILVNLLTYPKYSDTYIGVHSEKRFISAVTKVQDTYSTCSLPEKYVLGCAECMHIQTTYNCAFKNLILCTKTEPDYLSPEELREKWKLNKTTIAGYTLISPSLTSRRAVTSYCRDAKFHDFSYVNGNSAIRSNALRERGRIAHFKQETCALCFVKDECWEEAIKRNGSNGWKLRSCRGNYPESQYNTAREIRKGIRIPFTDKELTYLLANSGRLTRRIDRKKWWATLMLNSADNLVFVLRRITRPYEHTQRIVKNFKEAQQIIQTYKSYEYTPEPYKLTTAEKATLIELLTHDYSPIRGNWHKTPYPTLGVQFRPESREFVAYYRDLHGHRTLPWEARVTNLKSIYALFGTFQFADKTRGLYSKH